jgi:ribonuclease VapC
VLLREPQYQDLVAKLKGADQVSICTPILFETEMVMVGSADERGGKLVAGFLEIFEVEPIPFGESHCRAAVKAFLRYGKGRHPARLNYGDCMSYAAARVAERPLLFVGNDFAQTDIEAA